MLAGNFGLSPSGMRYAVCGVLLKKPDPSNWSEYPNVFQEVQLLVDSCPCTRFTTLPRNFTTASPPAIRMPESSSRMA